MKKLAVIGASYLQEPLIQRAKSMGLETHVFAWAAGDVGEKSADHFYPISIVEKEKILEVCRSVGIDGITSISSDLAMVAVNFVAERMGLTGNSPEATARSTNKHLMRLAFREGGDPSPRSILVDESTDLEALSLNFPVIVKPTDRSGSRGICRLESAAGLRAAVRRATDQGFEKKALVEEFAEGREYSVEYISWKGRHRFLALTQKFTTGTPRFVETGHLQPAPVSPEILAAVRSVTEHALDTLGLRFGASHTELKIDDAGRIRLIEIGGRMGGDFIGSDLVPMSTGVDFVEAVIRVALGEEPVLRPGKPQAAAVRFILTPEDTAALDQLRREHPEYLTAAEVRTEPTGEVVDSAGRFGYFLFGAETAGELLPYLPRENDRS